MDDITRWFVDHLPGDWFAGAPRVEVDRDEIVVMGRLPDAGAEGTRAEEARRIRSFREETRQTRMQIADRAEELFGRKVAWGAECGGSRQLFTTLSVPVMTRLRQPERMVLDTLVDAGVARSRSDALAWSVRLVGQHQQEWIDQLREALVAVEQVRAAGPSA